jgi:hypothetical protein
MQTKTEVTPEIHQWTHDGDRVLLVKCINRDGTSYGGFRWPQSGPVKPDKWSRTPDCDSGGLFGWPWGLHVGDGKDPDALADWIVFTAKPENVILVGCKAKAVPSDDEKELPEVLYRGTQAGAMYFCLAGRLAWIQERASGSSSATGYRGSSSATGERGSSSATGYRGSSSATGDRGSSSATGDRGSSSATGDRGSSSATGDRGSSSATGARGSSSATGDRGSSSATERLILGDRRQRLILGDRRQRLILGDRREATGERGSSSATGARGSSSATGDRGSSSATGYSGSSSATGERGSSSATGARGSSSATGYRGSSSATGYSGSSSATGDSGSSSATGDRGSSSATGYRGIAAATGEYSTVEVAFGIAACSAQCFYWRVRKGAVLICRWKHPDKDKFPFTVFDADKLKLKEGTLVEIHLGKIISQS